MDPQVQTQLQEMQRQITTMQQELEAFRKSPIKLPVPNDVRVNLGLGWIGKDTTTTPAGSLLVNSPEGPIKILYAS